MAAKGVKKCWDPYERSHRKQFIDQPNSAPQTQLRPASTSFADSCLPSGPFSSTVYNEEFSWKSACQPECIRTGTASGQRRNNPHPNHAFMVWRQPRDAPQKFEYVAFPWKYLPSDEEIHKALRAQYCSTYTCDFTRISQGHDNVSKVDGKLKPLHNKRHIQAQFCADTEMTANYQKPKQKPELLVNLSNRNPHVVCCGIVPTVVQRHIHTQQRGPNQTTYNRFYGQRVSNITPVIKSLLPQELQQLKRILSKDEKKFEKNSCSENQEKLEKLPTVVNNSYSPQWITSWPGPL